MSPYGYTLNVQRHTGLTCHFQFLTFGHLALSTERQMPECQKLKMAC